MTRYRFDPGQSKAFIEARSNVHPIHSSTDGLEGFIELDWDPDGRLRLDGTPAGRISLRVERLSSGNRLEDREMQKRIDSRRYPTIEGEVRSIVAAGERYRVGGDITFRGQTQKYEDLVDIAPVDEETVRLTGSSRFNIRDFGMEPPRILMLKVEPEVEVRVELIAIKEA